MIEYLGGILLVIAIIFMACATVIAVVSALAFIWVFILAIKDKWDETHPKRGRKAKK